jgi:SAM-dependent MidA family methyltransferase
VAKEGGAALLIDYGRDTPGFGDTLQAVAAHTKVSPLVTPGQADLTVHADFPAVAAAAIEAGAEATQVLSQADFLRALGIDQRAGALMAAAQARGRVDQAEVIGRQHARLMAHDQMGALFKAIAIHQKGLAVAGFEDRS